MLTNGFLFLFFGAWLWYHFLILGAIILVLLLLGIILIVHCRRRRRCMEESQDFGLNELNHMLEPFGFAYDIKRDLFYSRIDCWQRDQGYGRLYDEGAVYFNMLIDSEPIYFSYKGRQWLIQLWKGQYGMTTGAEVGIYNRTSDKRRKIGFYHAASDDEMMSMSFVLRKNGKVVMIQDAVHWWLTGFNLGEYSRPKDLSLEVWIDFPDMEMQRAFLGGLERAGYRNGEVCCSESNYRVYIFFDLPHTKHPKSRHSLYAAWIRRVNRKNCRIYQKLTNGRGCNTLEKLQYLMRYKPRMFFIVMNNLKNLYPKPPRKVLRLCRRDEKKYGSSCHREEQKKVTCMPEPPCCRPEPPCCRPEPPCCKPEPPCCKPEPPCCKPEPPCCRPEPPCCRPEQNMGYTQGEPRRDFYSKDEGEERCR